MPEAVVNSPTGTLPHMMGVHTFLTAYRGKEYASLDLHVHNGMDGKDNTDSKDNLLNDLYFKNLSLRMPHGWKVVFAFDIPGQGNRYQDGGYFRTDLVEALPNNKLHLMTNMSHFVRRLVICREGHEEEARELARSQYVAFCQPGETPTGAEQWSWWNEQTARYYPQNHALPKLDYIGYENVQGRLEGDLARFEMQFASGDPGAYPYIFGRQGWAHPWSIQHGGMPGGHEINTFAGHDIAWAASREGLRMSQLRSSGMVDRQSQVLYDINGDHNDYMDNVLYPENRQPWTPLWFYGRPTPGDNTFDFESAPTFQKTYVVNNGLEPDYAGDMRGFMPADYEHFIRYTHDLKTMAWLTNDALSRELLAAASENFRLSFHEIPNTNYDDAQGTGQLAATRFVNDYPGMGVPFGRGTAWGLDAVISYYALADDATRERYLPWFERNFHHFDVGQSTCTGNLASFHIWNHYNGIYRVRQAMENAFLENTLKSMSTTVFRDVDDTKADRIDEILVTSVRASFTGRFYNEEVGAPYFNNATGPRDIEMGNFCENAPAGTTSPYVNFTEYYSSLAYAYEISGDSFFMLRASQMLGGGDVLARLHEGQGVNLINTCALVALAQSMSTAP